MTVEGWIAYLSRQPRGMEVVIGDADPLSDRFLVAQPYEPCTVVVRGKGLLTAVVVGMSFTHRRKITRLRDPRPKPPRIPIEVDEGDIPGCGY